MKHQSRDMGNAMPTLLSTRTWDITLALLGQKQPCMTRDRGHLTSPAQLQGKGGARIWGVPALERGTVGAAMKGLCVQ